MKPSAENDQEEVLYFPPSTAGFFGFSRRWRPTAEIAKDQIASLYASMNCDSRYGVVSLFRSQNMFANLYFHHFPSAELPLSSRRRWPSALQRHPPPAPRSHERRRQHSRRVRPPFDGDSAGGSTKLGSKRTSPSSSRRCSRHGDEALRRQQGRPSSLRA